ncbi:MAG: bifunctional phosphoribosyl-AMP cyclohydrolase/phosphoribosyl-ATP pyrophosphatase, partial [SAR324 cluster bacterium]|nr:bifunctional phosphoribosyl-AMP cyclohydrolase/phosphoribosyl-ATP pyrophosphatase [SAR324 cluster bacterium]
AIHEAADLQFHPPIRMACADITPEDAERERGSRFGRSGLSERSPP